MTLLMDHYNNSKNLELILVAPFSEIEHQNFHYDSQKIHMLTRNIQEG